MAEIIEYTAIKSYTDIEQSKKLAKILPIESADMWHHGFFNPLRMCKIEYNPPAPYHSVTHQWDCPCWSLAALFNVLPQIGGIKPVLDLETNCIQYPSDIELNVTADNPVDACYEIIIRLDELNLLGL